MTIGDSSGPGGRHTKLYGIGGWLGFLYISLTYLTPIAAFINLVVDWTRPTSLVTHVITAGVDIGFATFAIFAGSALLNLRPRAVLITKIYMIVSLTFGVVAAIALASGSVITNGEVLQGFYQLVAPTVWLGYLHTSRRVRATYAPRATDNVSDVFT